MTLGAIIGFVGLFVFALVIIGMLEVLRQKSGDD